MSTTRFAPVRTTDQKAQLDSAREHFYALRFVEAYHVLRRFFDRLPFQPEPDHAEFMGIFARVLSELGKTSELKFYQPILENWYFRTKDGQMGYALAVLYRYLPEPRPESVRKTLEEVLSAPCSDGYRARAKMLLAHYYEWAKNDLVMCRAVIESIEEPGDPNLKTLWLIWRAKILRDQNRFGEALEVLDRVFHSITVDSDWYGFFSAEVILAGILAAKGDRAGALKVVEEVRALFEKKNFKALKILTDELEERVTRRPAPPAVRIRQDARRSLVWFGKGRASFKRGTPTERMLDLLVREGAATKKNLVERALNRPYVSGRDDKIVYHHVHTLRSKLREISLPEDVLVLEGEGYRFQATVHLESEEL